MGRITDKIIQLLNSLQISSASPGHINEVLQHDPSIDIDEEIKSLQDDKESIKKEKQVNDTVKKVKTWEDTNVGDLQKLSTEQMANVRAMAVNPAQFIISGIFRKFAKGAGVVTLAVILFETVKTILDQLFQPGRALDVRFREQIDKQVVLFLERKEQQELRQRFKQIIVTTIGGLRGSSLAGNVGGNFYNPERIPQNFLDERRVVEVNFKAIYPPSVSIFPGGQRRIR